MNPGQDADPSVTVRVSYAGADRMWAEWIRHQLDHARLSTTWDQWGGAGERTLAQALLADPERADRVLLVLSETYLRAGGHDLATWSSALAELGPRLDRVVAVVVGSCQPPPGLPVVDLTNADEEQARHQLLTAVLGAGQPRSAVDPAVGFPNRAPEVWGNVPPRNVNFTGRDAALLTLRERLATTIAAVVPSAMHGMGGVGKTQLAVEYAYRFASAYDVVWYVRAEQTALARFDLAELAPHLGVPESENLGETVRLVLDALRRGTPYRRWLLIFDNATGPAELRTLLPSGRGHVLVTSRDASWRAGAEILEIDVYRREESLRFLHKRAPRLTRDEAVRVAERLGDLPLALDAAGAWLEVTRMPITEYLDLAEHRVAELLDQVPVLPYEREVTVAWTLPMNRLRDERPAAAQLLRLCAFLGTDPIPVALLIGGTSAVRLPTPLHEQLRDPLRRGQILHDIGRYALAKVGSAGESEYPQTLQLHRIVQGVLRDSMAAEDHAELRRTAWLVLAAADPDAPGERGAWEPYAELLSHVDSTTMAGSAADAPVRKLVLNLVSYLQRRGEFGASRDLATTARSEWDRELDADDADRDALSISLANALRSMGDHRAAWEIDEQIVSRARTRHGPDHHTTLWAANGLAADLRQLGDWLGARDLDRDTLDRARRAFGPEHHRARQAAHNCAVSLRMVGEFAEALELDESTARLHVRDLGKTHHLTLLSVNNVARDMRELGRYAEAAALQEDTFATYRQVFGDDHPDTLRASKNLAVSLRKAGHHERSTALARDTAERHNRRFPEHHPERLAATTNLANDLRLIGDTVEAKARAEYAHTMLDRALGARHPYTLIAANNFGILLRLDADPSAADHDRRTLDRFREVLGERHPYTLACATNVASDLHAAGDLATAVRLGEETLELSTLVRGADHPYTLACATNLAMDLRDTGDRARSLELEESTVERYTRTLGQDHPETTAALARTRLDCDIEPPPM